MNTKNNRRSQETCQRIKDSLLALMDRRDVLDITVSRLCQAAGINRSTFYSHYEGVGDVMEELEQEIGAGLMGRLSAPGSFKEPMFSIDNLSPILEHIRDNRNFYRVYLSQSVYQGRVDWAFGQLLDRVLRPMMHDLRIDDSAIEYYFVFFKMGFVAVIRRWLQEGCREEPQVILSYLRNILSHPGFTL